MKTIQDRRLEDARKGGIFPDSKAMVHTHKIWKSIVIGTRSNVDILKSELLFADCFMGEGASAVMEQKAFKLTNEEMELDLVNTSVRELGLTKGRYYYSVICSVALEQGLWRSPAPDIGPELRLQYMDQPEDEVLRIPTMAGVTDTFGRPRIWVVMKHFGMSYLDISSGYPDVHFGPDDRFIFVRPRKI